MSQNSLRPPKKSVTKLATPTRKKGRSQNSRPKKRVDNKTLDSNSKKESCDINVRIPEILNIEGIRKNDKLIKKLRELPKLNEQQINTAADDVYNLIGINDILLKYYINNVITNINNTEGRNIFSILADTAQCNKSIGEENLDTNCYLCGYPLLKRKVHVMNSVDPLYPECEHVLPYIYGALYLKLVTNSQEYKQLPPFLKTLTQLEYKWSHKACNQLKSQAPFIMINEDLQYIPDEKNIKCFIEQLYNGNSKWALKWRESISLGDVDDPWFKDSIKKLEPVQYNNLLRYINELTTQISYYTDGELNFLKSVIIISFVKYLKANLETTSLNNIKKSITPQVKEYISKAWTNYRTTFQSTVRDTEKLSNIEIGEMYGSDFMSSLNEFGKKKNTNSTKHKVSNNSRTSYSSVKVINQAKKLRIRLTKNLKNNKRVYKTISQLKEEIRKKLKNNYIH